VQDRGVAFAIVHLNFQASIQAVVVICSEILTKNNTVGSTYVAYIPVWKDSDDVSGDKYGVRWGDKGCGRGWNWWNFDPHNVDVVEMNFDREEHHWSK
jgi:hypothetical protein